MDTIFSKINKSRVITFITAALELLCASMFMMIFLGEKNIIFIILAIIFSILSLISFYKAISKRGVEAIKVVRNFLDYDQVKNIIKNENMKLMSFRKQNLITATTIFYSKYWLCINCYFLPISLINGYYYSKGSSDISLYFTFYNGKDVKVGNFKSKDSLKKFLVEIEDKLHLNNFEEDCKSGKQLKEEVDNFNKKVTTRQIFMDGVKQGFDQILK